jgi:glycosyltransferase involved in cell wall biosynthesis
MSTTKKVLFISYDGMTDPLGQSQVIPYLQGLSKAGYKIFLISCEKEQVYHQNKEYIQQLLDKSNISWIPLNYTKNPPVLSTLFDVIKMRRAAKKLHKAEGIDMVHTRAGVPALIGLWMKKTMGVKFMNDIREFYADSRVEGGMWNTKNLVYKTIYNFFAKKESEAVNQSDGIVCLTYAAETIIKGWKEYKASIPLEVIPCSADLQLFDYSTIDVKEKAALKTELNISEDDFVISYLGSIGGWYLTAEMLQFCKLLSKRIPAAKFLFISPHRHEEIKAIAAQYEIPVDKVLVKKASRVQVPALLSLSSYSVFFIKPCYSKQSSSPTKHGEIMAMGIPVITNGGVGDVAEIVQSTNSGIVIDEFTDAVFESAINEVANKKDYDAAAIRAGAVKWYSLESAIEKYTRIYKSILG